MTLLPQASWSGLLHSEVGLMTFSLIKGSLIFVIGWLLARTVSRNCTQALEKTKIKKDLLAFLDNIFFYFILTLSLMAALSEMGIDTNSFLAVLGGAALAVGLGLKDQLSQLTAGIILLVNHPFRVGDFVTISGEAGLVESIDFFQTVLKTLDGKKVILPNCLAIRGVVTNFSGYTQRRIELPVTVSYRESTPKIKAALLNAAEAEPSVLLDPPPQAIMTNFKDHGVEVTLRCWVSVKDFGRVRPLLLEHIKLELEKREISVPLPTYTMNQAASN